MKFTFYLLVMTFIAAMYGAIIGKNWKTISNRFPIWVALMSACFFYTVNVLMIHLFGFK